MVQMVRIAMVILHGNDLINEDCDGTGIYMRTSYGGGVARVYGVLW